MIELNGISNMHVILDEYAGKHLVQAEFVDKMKKQLELMERYLLAYGSAMPTYNENSSFDRIIFDGKPPQWYEVLANPDQFPTNKEVSDGKTKG